MKRKIDLGAPSPSRASRALERMAEQMKSLTKEDYLRLADLMKQPLGPAVTQEPVAVKPSGDPALDYLIKRGVPRERWAIEYLRVTHGHIPKSIIAEELGEVIPAEIADEIALLYFDELGAMHFDLDERLIQKSTGVKQ